MDWRSDKAALSNMHIHWPRAFCSCPQLPDLVHASKLHNVADARHAGVNVLYRVLVVVIIITIQWSRDLARHLSNSWARVHQIGWKISFSVLQIEWHGLQVLITHTEQDLVLTHHRIINQLRLSATYCRLSSPIDSRIFSGIGALAENCTWSDWE